MTELTLVASATAPIPGELEQVKELPAQCSFCLGGDRGTSLLMSILYICGRKQLLNCFLEMQSHIVKFFVN